ncbi:hypothetical protein [Qipengyuania marisflavi]|uniref:Uncharacterized protein n=1 Tax=Qipengyuania marisflavi TaxID=2486356 RepID=A0A5S3P8B2_9SPHN|nr:hypothetical protein [Qipengyuania marisflavi]TMM49691.1 hypothetical protein FEV51_00320 [Qipengyuania marisflavi]
MKPIYVHLGGALALSFTIAACVPAPEPTPVPETAAVPAPRPAPPPPPVPVPTMSSWLDAPQSVGNWTYGAVNGGTMARFGSSNDTPLFALGCTSNSRQIAMIRYLPDQRSDSSVIIRTETTTRALAAKAANGGGAVSASVTAADPLLDAMALTIGRFAVEVPGQPALYIPAWAEVTRVIEDCR